MGTMMGVDCDLRIKADHTMTVQTGGCFHSEPAIRVRWQISGNKITWSDSDLLPIFASSTLKKRRGYDYEFCFWPNLLGDKGLELPKEAREFNKWRQQGP